MSEKSPGHRRKHPKQSGTTSTNSKETSKNTSDTTSDTATDTAGDLTGETASPSTAPASRRRGKKSTDPTITGRGLRQKFETGTVTDLLQRREKTLAIPMNGPGVVGEDTVHGIFDHHDTKFADKTVDSVFDAINKADVLDHVEARIAKRKKRKGRPTAIGYRALLVAIMLTAMDGKGCLSSEIARTLYFRLHPASMRLLDIKALPTAATAEEARRELWRVERHVRTALRRFLITLDPSIHPTGKEIPWIELRERDRPLTTEEILDNHDALTLVCNRILRIPYTLLPAKVRSKYRGSACIDATPLRLHTKGRGVDNTLASTDPNAGFYVRGGDHADHGNGVRKAFYGYDINLMVAACDYLGDNQYLPALPIAMHLDAPGVDAAGAARRVMTDLAAHVHQPNYLAGDGLYANATAETFHLPARSLGWKLVLPILDDHIGVQGSADGLFLVEGEWYCPSIPAILVDATKDFRAGAITRKEYLERIASRETYRARNKGMNDSGTQRWGCPASGAHPAVICALKPRSVEKKMIGGPVLGVRLKDRITPNPDTQTNGVWPKPCRQESVTIDLRPAKPSDADDVPRKKPSGADKRAKKKPSSGVDLAKYLQDLPFGTDQHTDIYNALRQSQEGLHGFAKDEGKEALGSSGKRRARGYAAQSLFAAVLLAAAGIRKVRAFLSRAIEDANGDLYVTRYKRKDDHAPTHLPPGTKGTRGDPAYDENVETALDDQGAA
ncbi:hypothetical protein CFI00_01155 [Nocardioides sp. S5]|uniref:hypothetical protein n=1 Tax=Nocardioides sp. S5 TaxID=2017486 RepID=UPI001A8E567E|nr:hypothetical protein [Nocardioides sp. S5]QSR29128.1 hypothetical protein CFI00_01155 [Nocardioides sp. S5]